MSWAYGVDDNGQEVGYSVADICREDYCTEKIDRGLDYRCGGIEQLRDSTRPGCGNFFCGEHRRGGNVNLTGSNFEIDIWTNASLCGACQTKWENDTVEQHFTALDAFLASIII